MILDKEAHILLAPILALATDENGRPMLPIDPVEDAATLATAHDMIPPAIVAIRQFWRARDPFPAAPLLYRPQDRAQRPLPVRVRPQI